MFLLLLWYDWFVNNLHCKLCCIKIVLDLYEDSFMNFFYYLMCNYVKVNLNTVYFLLAFSASNVKKLKNSTKLKTTCDIVILGVWHCYPRIDPIDGGTCSTPYKKFTGWHVVPSRFFHALYSKLHKTVFKSSKFWQARYPERNTHMQGNWLLFFQKFFKTLTLPVSYFAPFSEVSYVNDFDQNDTRKFTFFEFHDI